uniref:proline--tRNA ligase n=1 Tax=Octactis speculum TaxID=3111310 RepID=A0A7S2AQM6_9STRA|eukprot:CAMPEP_0185754578 /NCGR_PEP_ID=MMETSP1174-20130828/13210_1 /TAXON_ID=35687 /ORGANISM="Dictyocha speculum, Strain CCMP1381" /LENGTH=880 /DNA_ID=CAMNT_0028432853 /DNA_START=63 /DNA_END=2705 /DNA_ORIENTATION=-
MAKRSAALVTAAFCHVQVTSGEACPGVLQLDVPQGVIRGDGAVLRYIAKSKSSTSTDSISDGKIDSWVEFAFHELQLHAEKPAPDDLVTPSVSALGTFLENRTYLVGDSMTLADIAVCCALSRYAVLIPTNVNVDRWFRTCTAQPSFKELTQQPSAAPALAEVDETGNKAIDLLKKLDIEFKTYEHAEVKTVKEQASAVGSLPGVLTRNLLFKDKKHGFFLVVAHESRDTRDTKQLAKLLDLKGKTNLRLCDAVTLDEKLGVNPGSVSYLSIMNDTSGDVTLCLDSALLEQNFVNAHPLRCDRTVATDPQSLLKFVRHSDHEPKLLKYGDIGKKTDIPAQKPQSAKPNKSEKKPQQKKQKQSSGGNRGKQQKKGGAVVYKKSENFAQWYPEVVEKSEMLSYGDISGCYILRPWGYGVWEQIQKWFDNEIKKLDVENCYFPLFVSKGALEKEENHIEGFAPEVAWVTKAGDTDLAEPIAVRPTSETIMYPEYAKWIHSHRDLPLKLNQWNNVVRWEFKYPTPFLRSREFLWQEGHTAHANEQEADEMVYQILELYKQVYEQLCAVPVIKGLKTEEEKFAGGYFTTTCEAYIHGSGRSIQGATSHNLGQNFGKMFDIKFEDKDKVTRVPWQTSWGLTTRSIGVMIMVHSDDQGLVLPPRIAPCQVVIVPIVSSKSGMDPEVIDNYVSEVTKRIKDQGIRVKADNRDNYTAGWKYNYWEMKGVPIRVEIGASEIEKKTILLKLRYNGSKEEVNLADLSDRIPAVLDEIHANMLRKATEDRDKKLVVVKEWKDFVPNLNEGCMCLTPFCDEQDAENEAKARSKAEALDGEDEDERCATSLAAKTLCKPYDQEGCRINDLEDISTLKCFFTGKPAKAWVLWGRSY